MQNQLNPQYLQNAYPPTSCCYQAPQAAGPSVSAVNIQIFNPTAQASPQGFYQTNPCGMYPYNYNNAFIPQGGQNIGQGGVSPSQNQWAPVNPSMYQAMNLNGNQNGIAAQGEGESGKKTEEKKDKDKKDKPKVILTDDYIKTLENYLNSGDKKIRLMGAKELFDRFKEDETRKDDAALTALLNKSLQDPADTVKFMALTALDTGYATGNDETVDILRQIQTSDTTYGEDAALASQVLLKMSGYKSNAEAEKLNAQNKAAELTKNSAKNLTQPAYTTQYQAQANINNEYANNAMYNNASNPNINGQGGIYTQSAGYNQPAQIQQGGMQ